jgi:hypothetical protein
MKNKYEYDMRVIIESEKKFLDPVLMVIKN